MHEVSAVHATRQQESRGEGGGEVGARFCRFLQSEECRTLPAQADLTRAKVVAFKVIGCDLTDLSEGVMGLVTWSAGEAEGGDGRGGRRGVDG